MPNWKTPAQRANPAAIAPAVIAARAAMVAVIAARAVMVAVIVVRAVTAAVIAARAVMAAVAVLGAVGAKTGQRQITSQRSLRTTTKV